MKFGYWISTAIVFGLVTGLVLSQKPWIEWRRQLALTKEAESIMKQAEKDRANEARELAKRDSQIGREKIAREHGYRRPNEIPIDEMK